MKLLQAGLGWLNHKKIIINSSPFEYTLNVQFVSPFFKYKYALQLQVKRQYSHQFSGFKNRNTLARILMLSLQERQHTRLLVPKFHNMSSSPNPQNAEGGNLNGLNPLTPRSDSHVISPYNIHPLSSKLVLRILKCIRQKLLS